MLSGGHLSESAAAISPTPRDDTDIEQPALSQDAPEDASFEVPPIPNALGFRSVAGIE